jgi:hypothetical protein
VIYGGACYAVLALEEVLAAVGVPVRESLLPFGGKALRACVPP